MSASTTTPSPWTTQVKEIGTFVYGNGGHIDLIAHVCDRPEVAENARLIVASPALLTALVAILAEVIDYPRQRPHSSDSHLPAHLVEQACTALAAAGFDVASLQTIGGAT